MRNFEARFEDFQFAARARCDCWKRYVPMNDRIERAAAVKTTRITVETETLVVVRRAKAAVSWCPGCRAVVDVVTIDAGSLVEPATGAQLRQWQETGKLHLSHLASGAAQICVSSLLQCFE